MELGNLKISNQDKLDPEGKDKLDSEGKDEGVQFILKDDIYTFLALLLSKTQQEYANYINGESIESFMAANMSQTEGLIKLFSKFDAIKLYSVAILSYLLQMFGFLYIGFSPSLNDFYENTNQVFLLNCNSIINNFTATNYVANNYRIYNNSNAISNQECDLFQDTWVGLQNISGDLFCAKVIAVLMTICFSIGDMLELPKISVLICNCQQLRFKMLWFLIFIIKAMAVIISVIRIFILIFDSQDIINVLTVGISFIILTDIDNKLFELVIDLKYYLFSENFNFFLIKFKHNDIKYTIYDYVTPKLYDLILFFNTLFWCLFITIYYNFIYNRYTTEYPGGSIVTTITVLVSALLFVLPIALLVVLIVFSWLKKKK